jgi:hypothetical protein
MPCWLGLKGYVLLAMGYEERGLARTFGKIAQEIDAMSPEERAEYLTNRTFERQRADEEHFAAASHRRSGSTFWRCGRAFTTAYGAYARSQQASYISAFTPVFQISISLVD